MEQWPVMIRTTIPSTSLLKSLNITYNNFNSTKPIYLTISCRSPRKIDLIAKAYWSVVFVAGE